MQSSRKIQIAQQEAILELLKRQSELFDIVTLQAKEIANLKQYIIDGLKTDINTLKAVTKLQDIEKNRYKAQLN